MEKEYLVRHFARVGALLKIGVRPAIRRFWWTRDIDVLIDVIQTPRGEAFHLTVDEEALPDLDIHAVDVQPKQKHLLLLVKRLSGASERRKEKFLCGLDECHWFVAAVPEARGIAHVEDAMEALKPRPVLLSQHRNKVKRRDRNKRRNAGFIRQGEWFFLPRPGYKPIHPNLILRNEPIRRGRGKPHIVEEVFRIGGETVYVSHAYPNGLQEEAYRHLLRHDPTAHRLGWRVMQRNPTVYARGKVRHPDHKTVVLPFWHQVAMNVERSASTVAFLD